MGETEREEYERRILEVLDFERKPGEGIVISLSGRKEKREARDRLKRTRRLAQLRPGQDEQKE